MWMASIKFHIGTSYGCVKASWCIFDVSHDVVLMQFIVLSFRCSLTSMHLRGLQYVHRVSHVCMFLLCLDEHNCMLMYILVYLAAGEVSRICWHSTWCLWMHLPLDYCIFMCIDAHCAPMWIFSCISTPIRSDVSASVLLCHIMLKSDCIGTAMFNDL